MGFDEEELAQQRFGAAEPFGEQRVHFACERVLEGDVLWFAEEREELREQRGEFLPEIDGSRAGCHSCGVYDASQGGRIERDLSA